MSETVKINILVKAGADGVETKEVDAYKIGSVAVHKYQTDAYESDDWVITGVSQGLKFPGKTSSLKVARACAHELNGMFDWEYYDPEKNKSEALKAKEILASWGVEDFGFL